MNKENGKPDKEEKGIRFGCGSLFGLLIGLFLCFNTLFGDLFFTNNLVILGIITSLILLCGFLAMKKGDKFWYNLSKLFPWWWQ